MRYHHLPLNVKKVKKHKSPSKDTKKRSSTAVSVNDCVNTIMFAADRKMRKVYFPFKAYFAIYIRPFLPDLIDK